MLYNRIREILATKGIRHIWLAEQLEKVLEL